MMQAALLEVRAAWQDTAQQLQQREAVQVQQVGQAVQQLREDLQHQLPSGKLKAIESKLAALEGSVLSAGAIQVLLQPFCMLEDLSQVCALSGQEYLTAYLRTKCTNGKVSL